MNQHYKILILIFLVIVFEISLESCHKHANADETKISYSEPEVALQEMKDGNARFLSGHLQNINYLEDIQNTKEQQYPHTLVLSCLDSRVPPEIIFDQGIGRIFVAINAIVLFSKIFILFM